MSHLATTLQPSNRARLQTLLDSWLRREASPQAASMMTPAVRQQLVDILNQVLTPALDVNLDIEDLSHVLSNSHGFLFSQTIAAGPDRALVASRQLWETATLVGNDTMIWPRLLLCIQSGPVPELEMDELVNVTEYIQQHAGEQTEMVFGHGIDTALGSNVRVTLLANLI
jgi:cell division protein FtsZ